MYKFIPLFVVLAFVGFATAQDIHNPQTDASQLTTGTLPAARMPALTGDVTTSAGAVATTITNNAVTNAKAAQMATGTIKGRTTAGTGDTEDLTATQASAIICGGSGSITAPTSWTPTDGSGAALTFTNVSANYTRICNMIFAYGRLTYPVTASGASTNISGLPIATANANYATQCSLSYSTVGTAVYVLPEVNNITFSFYTSAGANVSNSTASTGIFVFMCIYPAT